MSKRRYFNPILYHRRKRGFRLIFAVVLTATADGIAGTVRANLPAFLGPSSQESVASASSAPRGDSIPSAVSPSPLSTADIPAPVPLPPNEAAKTKEAAEWKRPVDASVEKTAAVSFDNASASEKRASSDNVANAERITPGVAPISTAPVAAEKTPIVSETDSSAVKKAGAADGFGRIVTGIIKLLVVLAAVFALFYFMKRFSPRGNRPLPKGVIEILGQYPLTVKSRLTVLRFGSKLLLVSMTGERIERLAELEDPDEIAEVTLRCQAEPSDEIPSLTETWIQRWKGKGRAE